MRGGTTHAPSEDGRAWTSGRAVRNTVTAGSPGQTTVEFALVALLVLGTGLTLAQFAWYVYARHVVATAVAEGARVGSAADRTMDDGAAYARRVLELGLGSGAQSVAVGATQDGELVVVEAHGRMPLVVPWPADGAPALDARAAVARERFRPAELRP